MLPDTYKADKLGYQPLVILTGRHINDGMGQYIAEQRVKPMIRRGRKVKGARVTVPGLTFKENCPDLRNSRVLDMVRELQSYGIDACVHDPIPARDGTYDEYGVALFSWDD